MLKVMAVMFLFGAVPSMLLTSLYCAALQNALDSAIGENSHKNTLDRTQRTTFRSDVLTRSVQGASPTMAALQPDVATFSNKKFNYPLQDSTMFSQCSVKFHQNWETDFLPLLVLTHCGRSTGKTSTGNDFLENTR